MKPKRNKRRKPSPGVALQEVAFEFLREKYGTQELLVYDNFRALQGSLMNLWVPTCRNEFFMPLRNEELLRFALMASSSRGQLNFDYTQSTKWI